MQRLCLFLPAARLEPRLQQFAAGRGFATQVVEFHRHNKWSDAVVPDRLDCGFVPGWLHPNNTTKCVCGVRA
eukprot:1117986-Lingulodinium_polyedra.AAC.1